MGLLWKRLALAALFTTCSLVPLSAHAAELPIRPHIVPVPPGRGVTPPHLNPNAPGLTLHTVGPSIDLSFAASGQMLISGQNFPANDQLELVISVDPNSLFGGTLLDTNVETAGVSRCRTSRECTNEAPGTFVLNVDPSIAFASLECGDTIGITASDVNQNVLASTAFTNCFPL